MLHREVEEVGAGNADRTVVVPVDRFVELRSWR